MDRRQIAKNKILEGLAMVENGILMVVGDIPNGEETLKLFRDVRRTFATEVFTEGK